MLQAMARLVNISRIFWGSTGPPAVLLSYVPSQAAHGRIKREVQFDELSSSAISSAKLVSDLVSNLVSKATFQDSARA